MIITASLAVLTFLFWLIYFCEPAGPTTWSGWLPHLNAFFNGITATFLTSGYLSIKRGRVQAHIRFMSLAVLTSALFLIGYCIYHYYHQHTTFQETGNHPLYLLILAHLPHPPVHGASSLDRIHSIFCPKKTVSQTQKSGPLDVPYLVVRLRLRSLGVLFSSVLTLASMGKNNRPSKMLVILFLQRVVIHTFQVSPEPAPKIFLDMGYLFQSVVREK